MTNNIAPSSFGPSGSTLQSNQLHSVLRYGGGENDDDNDELRAGELLGTANDSRAVSIEAPWQQQFMFEESNATPQTALAYRLQNNYTPQSSVRFDFANQLARNGNGTPLNDVTTSSPPPRTAATVTTGANSEASTTAASSAKDNKMRNAIIISAIVLLLLIGIGIAVWWFVSKNTPTTPSVPSNSSSSPAVSSSSVLGDTFFEPDDDREDAYFYSQQKLVEQTSKNSQSKHSIAGDGENSSTFDFGGIPIPEIDSSVAPNKDSFDSRSVEDSVRDSDTVHHEQHTKPSRTNIKMAEPRNTTDERRRATSQRPPAPSWFGVSDAPHRADQKRDIDTGVLNAQGDIGKLYDKSRGGNSVIGDADHAPYGTVNAEAARFIGWAEQTPYDPSTDPSLDPNNGSRTIMSLYQDKMKQMATTADSARDISTGDQQRVKSSSMYRDGLVSSTATAAAEQAARVGDPRFESSEEQFAEGRARGKQIASEVTAAINGIYERKHRAAAGNVVVDAASQQDDPNFAYFNMSTQSMLGNE